MRETHWDFLHWSDSHTSTVHSSLTLTHLFHHSFDSNHCAEILLLYSNVVFLVGPFVVLFLACFGGFCFFFFASSKFHMVLNKTDLVGKQNFKYFCGPTTPLSTLTCREDCVGFRESSTPKKAKHPNPSVSEWLESLLCYPGEHSLLTDYLRYI